MSKKLIITPEMVSGEMSYREIKEKYNISKTTVINYRKKYGIKSKTAKIIGKVITPEMVANTMTYKEIKEKYNLNVYQIHRERKRFGIEVNKDLNYSYKFLTKELLGALTNSQITEKYGVISSTISEYRKRLGVPCPTKYNITPEMVAANFHILEIQKKYGMSVAAIVRARRIFGIKSIRNAQNKGKFISKESLLGCYNVVELAKKLGVSKPTVRKYMRMYGITLPRFNKIKDEPTTVCPRCGANNWQKQPGGQYFYCVNPTPNDPRGFSRCWYHRGHKVKYGGAA